MAFPSLALNIANSPDALQFTLKPRDPFLDAAAINFELGFTGTSCSDSASLPRQVGPHSPQPRAEVLRWGQLDLQTPFPAPGALRENIENELRPIEGFP